MNFAPRVVKCLEHVLVFLLLSAPAAAQPLCDVLLRPAFHYTTAGLVVQVADSSRSHVPVVNTIWNFGDGSSLTTQDQHTYLVPGNYTVCLTLVSEVPPCTATYCKEIIVPLDTCVGSPNAFFNWYQGGENTANFEQIVVSGAPGAFWDLGDGNTTTGVNPEHTWALPGPHFVTLTLTDGTCSNSYGTWVEVDGNATTCGPGLFVNFFGYSDGTDVYFEPSVSANGVVPLLYVWSYGDGTLDTAMVGMHTYATEGAHQTCLLVGAISGTSLDTCFALVCRTENYSEVTSLNELAQEELRVWPNPCTDILRIAGASPKGTLRLIDPLGRVVRTSSLGPPNPSLDLSGLPNGAYTLILTGLEKRATARVIKVQE